MKVSNIFTTLFTVMTVFALSGCLREIQDVEEVTETNAFQGTEFEGSAVCEPREEPDFSFLSAEAQDVHDQIRALREEMRAEVQDICPRDEDLRDSVRGEMDSLCGQGLSGEELRAAMRDLHDEYGASLREDRENFRQCAQESADVQEIRESHRALAEACLVRPDSQEQGQGGPGGRRKGRVLPQNWSETLQLELEEKLLSDECAEALSSDSDEEDDAEE